MENITYKNYDVLSTLPTDKIPPTQSELQILNTLFNHKKEINIPKKITCTMEEYKKYKLFSHGVDVKLLTFEENAINRSEHVIDLCNCMEKSIFHKKLNNNFILINIESDKFRL